MANVVVTRDRSYYISHETRTEQQNATIDLKSCTSIVHGQHDNIIRNCGLSRKQAVIHFDALPTYIS